MGQKQTFHRHKNVVFTPRDELAFSRVLREAFPSVKFVEDDYRSHPCHMPVIDSIAHTKTERVQIIIPSPGQEIRMKINEEFGRVLVQPECGFQYDRSHWEYFYDPSKKFAFNSPLLGWGVFAASFPRDDPENKKFAAKVMRLTNKITPGGALGYDAMRYSMEGGKRCGVGIGVHIDDAPSFENVPYYNDELWDDSLLESPALPKFKGFRV